jgi:aspartate aminotransferase-like enzyme
MINHRGTEFAVLLSRVTDSLKHIYQTRNDVFTLTSSGTGGLEAAIVNSLSPGDSVLSFSCGVFGNRFADIARRYGADVKRVDFAWGQPVEPEVVEHELKATPSAVAVLFTHNETSTGVTNDLKTLAALARQHDKLVLVDAISSLGCIDLRTDEWGCDVVVSASHKAYMAPPGLAMLSMSERAWKACEQARMPRFYFDLKRAKHALGDGQVPWTPALPVMFAMDETLKLLLAEGLPAVFERHARVGAAARSGIKVLGLKLFATESHASNCVTAVEPAEHYDVGAIIRLMREQHGIVLAGGQSTLKGRIFRIGHLGYVTVKDVGEIMSALVDVLPRAQRKEQT